MTTVHYSRLGLRALLKVCLGYFTQTGNPCDVMCGSATRQRRSLVCLRSASFAIKGTSLLAACALSPIGASPPDVLLVARPSLFFSFAAP